MKKIVTINSICCTAVILMVATTAMAAETIHLANKAPKVKVSQLYYSPAPAKAGSMLTLGIKVDNSGGAASGTNYNIWLGCTALSGGPCPINDSQRPLPSIAAGGTHNVSLTPAAPWPAGKYKLSFSVIDPAKNKTGVMEMELPVAGPVKTIGTAGRNLSTQSNAPQNPGTIKGFNPQPEPPARMNPGTIRGFSPQPEPPAKFNPGEKVGLNPQPEPPGIISPALKKGINPQPEPPGMK